MHQTRGKQAMKTKFWLKTYYEERSWEI